MAKSSEGARRKEDSEPRSVDVPDVGVSRNAKHAKGKRLQDLETIKDLRNLSARLRNALLKAPPVTEPTEDLSIFQNTDLGYTGRVKLQEVCSRFVQSLARGEALNISTSEMPTANIPEHARSRLAELWADDVARVELEIPLRTTANEVDTLSQAQPATPAAQSGEAVVAPAATFLTGEGSFSASAEVFRPVPKTWEEAKAENPDLAKWDEAKRTDDTPPSFIMRHYAPWLGKGLTSGDIYRLDRSLYTDYKNWCRSNSLPEGFDLPTKQEHNNRLIAAFKGGTLKVSASPTDQAKTLKRLGDAVRNRGRPQAASR